MKKNHQRGSTTDISRQNNQQTWINQLRLSRLRNGKKKNEEKLSDPQKPSILTHISWESQKDREEGGNNNEEWLQKTPPN